MCIIIDTNALPGVFNDEADDHEEFKPVYDWIENGKGKIVYGGGKYDEELKKAYRYLVIINEYERRGKVVFVCNEKVDKKEIEIKSKVNNSRLNDAHLIAIVNISKCRLICSKDSNADEFLKMRSLYSRGVSIPKIYRNSSHRHLLTDSNIAKCCRHC